MQKIIELTNKYIVLTTPLILYSLFSSIYLTISISGGKLINLIFAALLFFLMTGAFFAGWFNMIKLAIINQDKDYSNSLLKEFISGVGEYFLPSLAGIFIIFTISALALTISYYIGIQTIGDIGIPADVLSGIKNNTIDPKTFITGLSAEQLIKINLWNLLVLANIAIAYFLCFLYMPALFLKNKNPLFAFWISLKDIFSKKFFHTLGIFILIFTLNFLISMFSTIFSENLFIHFVLTLLNFYFITAVGVGVFYYYYDNFVSNKLGQNVDIKI